MNILDTIIENVYVNTRIEKGKLEKMIDIKNSIKSKIGIFFNSCYPSYNAKISDQGSHKTHTNADLPDTSEDVDMDISVILHIKRNPSNIIRNIRLQLAFYLDLQSYNVDVRVSKIGKCAIKFINNTNGAHFDIVFYNQSKTGCQQVFYNGELHDDAKSQENEYIINCLSGDKHNRLKKIICFLKFIYKSLPNNPKYKCKLPSIAIVEMVIQCKIDIDVGNSLIILNILKTCINKLSEKFAIYTSNNTRENLLNNKRRKLPKKSTLKLLNRIYNSLTDIYNYSTMAKTNVLKYIITHSENKYALLDKVDYYCYKLAKKLSSVGYKNTIQMKYFNRKLNKLELQPDTFS
jgi:hypothetical protein